MSTETSTAGNFLKFSGPAVTARAVKGGEAEAPDVSAPSLEGPEHSLITMEWPAGHRPAWMPIVRPGDPDPPRL